MNISNNNLEVFPILPEETTEVDASGNRILDLQVKDCPNLTALDVSHNLICSVIGYLPITLKILDIQGNKLKHLNLEMCVNLEELSADHNLLQEIKLPINIKNVSLSVNSLLSIDIPASVEVINISDNEELSDFTINSVHESKLIQFHAHNTNLVSIIGLPNSVNEIDISKTQIEIINELPTELRYFTGVSFKLKYADFSKCKELNCVEVAYGDIQMINMPKNAILSKQHVLIDQDNFFDNVSNNLNSSGETFMPNSRDLGFIDDFSEQNWGDFSEINQFKFNATQNFTNDVFIDSFDDFAPDYKTKTKTQTAPQSLNQFFKYNLTI